MTTYRPGDICWDVHSEGAQPIGAILVTAVCEVRPLGPGRVLETYLGCSFHPGRPPEAIEQFAVVVSADRASS